MDCRHIPDAAYADFAARINKRISQKRFPLSGVMEVTFRCNLACGHCYCRSNIAGKEMSGAECRRALDEIAGEGCLWLLFTGGEPFLRPDFPDIYTHAKKLGMLVTIFTNGTLITPEIADRLEDHTPSSVEITLYGATEGTYENVTGVKGSFNRCMDGIRLLLERGIPLDLKTVVTTVNQHEFWQMKAFANKVGVDFRFDYSINPSLDGTKAPCALRIPLEDAVALDIADAERLEAWKKYFSGLLESAPSDLLYTCGAGKASFTIDPYGALGLCTLMRKPNYNILDGSFKEGWDHMVPAILAAKRLTGSKCPECDIRELCDMCPGWSQLETGSDETPVDYLCRMAKLRAEAFGFGKHYTDKKEARNEEELYKAGN